MAYDALIWAFGCACIMAGIWGFVLVIDRLDPEASQ